MQTISLDKILTMSSNDAFGYAFCEDCGNSQERIHFATNYCELCGEVMRPALTVGEVIGAKKRDPWYGNLLDSIKANGIDTPVYISCANVYNGHHRIAVASDLGITDIPCTDNSQEYCDAEMDSDWDEGSEELGY